MRRRAETLEETRKRIVEAAVELHSTIGPLNTTDFAIAQKAGVTRRTFYRHFPDDLTLFRACSSDAMARWPTPDPKPWQRIRDPVERLRVALKELYALYAIAGRRIAILMRDTALLRPELRPKPSRADLMRALNEVLLEGWGARGRKREVVGAAIAHATSVTTWQSLVGQQGLKDAEAVEMLTAMVLAAAR